MQALAPWGGVWGVEADAERQPFDAVQFEPAERLTAKAMLADWGTDAIRWELQGGIEQRNDLGQGGVIGGGLRWVTGGDRIEARGQATTFLGTSRFAAGELSVAARSRATRVGMVLLGSGSVHAVSAAAPLELWAAGDTGDARQTLVRAHPVLDDGRLRIERLGRLLVSASVEAQRWWALRGPVRVAGALFVDAARTASRVALPVRHDVDPGVGLRLAVTGVPGVFRVDLAKGLSDGASVLSLTYVP
jgi:hypothetical protein